MIFGSKKLSKMVAISALSAALGAVLFTTSATASEIKYMERIAPAYRDGASANMLSLTSLEDVKNFTKNFKEEFGTIKPEIIKVPNEFEQGEVEVSLYKPQACTEPSDKCPVYADVAVKQDRRMDRPLVVFLHGGGFLFRNAYYMSNYYQTIANTLQANVIVPKYRLSTEKPFPAQLHDSYSALTYFYQNADKYRINTDAIVLMGESAGGGLAAGMSLFNRDHYDFPIAGQVMTYPMLDYRTGTNEVVKAEKTGEVLWTPESNVFAWSQYGDAKEVAHMAPDARKKLIQKSDYLGYFSPTFAQDLSNMPASFIYVGDIDLFVSESLNFANQLVNAGNEVELHVENGVYHCFDYIVPEADESAKYRKALFNFMADRMYGVH